MNTQLEGTCTQAAVTDDQLRTLDRLLALGDQLHDACARAACTPGVPPNCLRMIREAWHAIDALTIAHAATLQTAPKRPGPKPGPKRPRDPQTAALQTAPKIDRESE